MKQHFPPGMTPDLTKDLYQYSKLKILGYRTHAHILPQINQGLHRHYLQVYGLRKHLHMSGTTPSSHSPTSGYRQYLLPASCICQGVRLPQSSRYRLRSPPSSGSVLYLQELLQGRLLPVAHVSPMLDTKRHPIIAHDVTVHGEFCSLFV